MDTFILSTDGKDDMAAQRRLSILQRNRELMEHYFALSSDKDTAFLIYELTPGTKMPADVEKFVARSVESQMIPTRIVQAPRWSLYRMLRQFQRELHRSDRRNPKESSIVEQLVRPAKTGHFWAVVIAQKGKQAVELPAADAQAR
jgi:hypothetical protein